MTILLTNPGYNEMHYKKIALYMCFIFSDDGCSIYEKPLDLYVLLIFFVQ